MSEAIVFDDILCNVFVSVHMRVNSRFTTRSVTALGILPWTQISKRKNTALCAEKQDLREAFI